MVNNLKLEEAKKITKRAKWNEAKPLKFKETTTEIAKQPESTPYHSNHNIAQTRIEWTTQK